MRSGWEWLIRNCVLLQLLQAVLVVYLYAQGGYVQFHSEGGKQQLHPFSFCENLCHRKWILWQLMLCLRNDDWHLNLCISLFDCKIDHQRDKGRCKCLPRWEWFLLSHRFVSEDMGPVFVTEDMPVFHEASLKCWCPYRYLVTCVILCKTSKWIRIPVSD